MKESNIAIELNGITYNSILEASVSRSLDSLSGQFSFTLSLNDIESIPVTIGSPIKIIVANEVFLNGYVETMHGTSSDSSGNKFQFSGRDATCDLIDSTFLSKTSFTTPITLESIINKCIDNLGLSGRITTKKTTSISTNFGNGESLVAEKGDFYVEFLQKYANKKNVLLTTDGNASIVITTANTIAPTQNIYKDSQSFDNSNNVISSSYTYDLSNRYYQYQSQSQQQFSDTYDTDQAVNITGSSIDSEIRSSRKISIDSQFSNDESAAKSNAIYERNLRIGDSFSYNVVVQGFFPVNSNSIWNLNTLVSVFDNDLGIYQDLLVEEVDFNYSLYDGAKTSLKLIPPIAYTTFEQEKVRKNKNTSKKIDIINQLIPEARKNL